VPSRNKLYDFVESAAEESQNKERIPTMQRSRLALIVLAGFSLNLALSQVSSASAREITITGQNGRSLTTQQNVTRDGNTIDVNDSTTFPNGSTRSYSNDLTRNSDGSFNDSINRSYGRSDILPS